MTPELALHQAALAITDERAVLQSLAWALATCAPDCLGLAATLKEAGGLRFSCVVSPGGKVLEAAPAALVRACRVGIGSDNVPFDTEQLADAPPSVTTFGASFRNPIRTTRSDDGAYAALVAVFPPSAGSLEHGLPAIMRTLAHAAALANAAATVRRARSAEDAMRLLLSTRTEASAVSVGGGLLGATPKAERMLAHHPDIRRLISLPAAPTAKPGPREVQAGLREGSGSPPGGPPDRRGPSGSEAVRAVTPRQSELLELVAQGLTNAEVATRMGIAAGTVKTMLGRLYNREGVRGRVALMRVLTRT